MTAIGLPAENESPPILSSQSLGWQSLLVEEFQDPPCSQECATTFTEHSIALCLAPRPHRIIQVVGEKRYSGIYSKGDISITPALLPSSYRAEGEDYYLHVQIQPEFLKKVAEEAIELDSEQIQLNTEFKTRDPQMEQILTLLRGELHKGGGWVSNLYVDSLANVLAVSLLRDYSTSQPRLALYDGGLGDRRLLQIADYIESNLDRDISLADLARLTGISQFHFSRLFKQSVGISPHQYLLQQRVERAKQLLKTSRLPIADIAFNCGFNSQSHFGKYFREFVGTTPNNYRKS